MDPQQAIARIRAFSPTGDEPADLETLYALLEPMGEPIADEGVRRELFAVFERNPGADLGSPGPIVHALEKSPLDAHVQLLAESLGRRATIMTVWMAGRCLRSPKLAAADRRRLLDALAAAVRAQALSSEERMAIDDALRSYGGDAAGG